MQSFSPGYGFTGLLICLLAFNEPLLTFGIAFLFSVLQTGSVNLQLLTSVPAEISGVLQAIMVLFVAAFKTFMVWTEGWLDMDLELITTLFRTSIRMATPILLASLGGALTFHAGIINVAMEGLMLISAFFSRVFISAGRSAHMG